MVFAGRLRNNASEVALEVERRQTAEGIEDVGCFGLTWVKKGVYTSYTSQAYLMLELLDDTGKRTSPPMATKFGLDTRLQAYETRTLSYSIPAENVALVRGE